MRARACMGVHVRGVCSLMSGGWAGRVCGVDRVLCTRDSVRVRVCARVAGCVRVTFIIHVLDSFSVVLAATAILLHGYFWLQAQQRRTLLKQRLLLFTLLSQQAAQSQRDRKRKRRRSRGRKGSKSGRLWKQARRSNDFLESDMYFFLCNATDQQFRDRFRVPRAIFSDLRYFRYLIAG